jgi:hypothetical protein
LSAPGPVTLAEQNVIAKPAQVEGFTPQVTTVMAA